mmetsp:Transcript_43082/g.100371  ORF Transcript_43082/g.100371 Transcript_43082/m.100371 type:complete len:464 (+) Transcript_43082:72-1463(+)
MSDVIAKRRIFSEARKKLQVISATLHQARELAGIDGTQDLSDPQRKAQTYWDVLRHACNAIVDCSRETLTARKAVAAILEHYNTRPSREERQYEVQKLRLVCEALSEIPDPEEHSEDEATRQRSKERKQKLEEVCELAQRFDTDSFVERVNEVEEMQSRLQALHSEFSKLDVEGVAVQVMEEALGSVRSILDMSQAMRVAESAEEKARLQAAKQDLWQDVVDAIPSMLAQSREKQAMEVASEAGEDGLGDANSDGGQTELFLSDQEVAPWSASTASTWPKTSTPLAPVKEVPERWPSPAENSFVEELSTLEEGVHAFEKEQDGQEQRGRLRRARRWVTTSRDFGRKHSTRRSIAAIHMQRAGGFSLEAVLSLRERHGLRADRPMPRLPDFQPKFARFRHAHANKPCICVDCLRATTGGEDSSAQSMTSLFTSREQASKLRSKYAARRKLAQQLLDVASSERSP